MAWRKNHFTLLLSFFSLPCSCHTNCNPSSCIVSVIICNFKPECFKVIITTVLISCVAVCTKSKKEPPFPFPWQNPMMCFQLECVLPMSGSLKNTKLLYIISIFQLVHLCWNVQHTSLLHWPTTQVCDLCSSLIFSLPPTHLGRTNPAEFGCYMAWIEYFSCRRYDFPFETSGECHILAHDTDVFNSRMT